MDVHNLLIAAEVVEIDEELPERGVTKVLSFGVGLDDDTGGIELVECITRLSNCLGSVRQRNNSEKAVLLLVGFDDGSNLLVQQTSETDGLGLVPGEDVGAWGGDGKNRVGDSKARHVGLLRGQVPGRSRVTSSQRNKLAVPIRDEMS